MMIDEAQNDWIAAWELIDNLREQNKRMRDVVESAVNGTVWLINTHPDIAGTSAEQFLSDAAVLQENSL